MPPLPVFAASALAGIYSWPWWQPPWLQACFGAFAVLVAARLARARLVAGVGLAVAGFLAGGARVSVMPAPFLGLGDGELRGWVATAGTGREAEVEGALWTAPGEPTREVWGAVRVRFQAPAPPPGTFVVVQGTLSRLDPTRLPGLPDPSADAARAGVARLLRSRQELLVRPDPAPVRGAELPHGGLMRALVLGDTTGIPDAERLRLRRTGTWHLVSISGLHIGLAGSIGWGLGWGATRILVLFGVSSGLRWVSAAGAVAAALGYAGIAGWPTPAVRAVWMVGVAAVAAAAGRSPGGAQLLGLALVCVLWADPGAAGRLSFQLSFGAMFGMVCVIPVASRYLPPDAAWWLRLPAGALATSLGATAGTLPVVALWFQDLSPLTSLANLWAVPLVGTVATPLTLAAQVLPGAAGGVCAALADAAISLAYAGLAIVDVDPWHPATSQLGAVVLLLAPLIARRPLLWLLATAAPLVHLWPREEGLHVEYLAVGQGDAALLRWGGGQTWLIDGGPDPDEVLRYLRREGVRKVDRVLLSHPHPDHSTGLLAVVRELDVAEIWAPRLPFADERDFQALVLGRRVRLPGDPSPGMVVLHPLAGWRSPAPDPVNDESLSVRIDVGRRRFLFVGDVERAGEATLAGLDIRADVLKVAHHGSATSSTAPFVAAAAPSLAVVSCGFENRFRHPRPETLWALRGTRVLRTDRDGTIDVWTDGETLTVERRGAPEPWRLRDPG